MKARRCHFLTFWPCPISSIGWGRFICAGYRRQSGRPELRGSWPSYCASISFRALWRRTASVCCIISTKYLQSSQYLWRLQVFLYSTPHRSHTAFGTGSPLLLRSWYSRHDCLRLAFAQSGQYFRSPPGLSVSRFPHRAQYSLVMPLTPPSQLGQLPGENHGLDAAGAFVCHSFHTFK